METIEKDDIEIEDIILNMDDTYLLMAKLKNTKDLLNKLGLGQFNGYYVEIYFNYFIKTKINEFEIMVFVSNDKKDLINDFFINITKNELSTVLAKVQEYFKEKKEKTYV